MAAVDREVREVMTPGVVTISADASLRRVHGALVAHGVNAVLVVERKGGRPLGWITARSLARIAIEGGREHTAAQAIAEPARTVSPSASVRQAVEEMLATDASHLLVSHGPDCMPEGVVSPLDVMRAD
jgi:CBS domain-containing protein